MEDKIACYEVELRRNDGQDNTIAAADLADAQTKARSCRTAENYMVCITQDGDRILRWDRAQVVGDNSWTAVDPDEFETIGPLRAVTHKFVDLFGDELQPDVLRCYKVGESDWFAASSPENALTLMQGIMGDEEEYEVELTSDEELDARWSEEGAPTVDAGSLREWLAAAKEPGWIAGTEP